MTNEKDKQADDFFRKLCAGGFRDQEKGIEGGHRNPRPKRDKKKARRNNKEHQNILQESVGQVRLSTGLAPSPKGESVRMCLVRCVT